MEYNFGPFTVTEKEEPPTRGSFTPTRITVKDGNVCLVNLSYTRLERQSKHILEDILTGVSLVGKCSFSDLPLLLGRVSGRQWVKDLILRRLKEGY